MLGSARAALVLFALGFAVLQRGMGAQELSLDVVRPNGDAELRSAAALVAQMERAGGFQASSVERDPAFPARLTERFHQVHQGVPVFGASIVRESEAGQARSILGTLVPNLEIDTRPSIDVDRAAGFLRRAGDAGLILQGPSLVILPLASGATLAYSALVAVPADVLRIFVDARTGGELLRFTELQGQAAVGEGRGVLGDRKKISVLQQAGAFYADDRLRPPVLTTYDMRFNLNRAVQVLGGTALTVSDVAIDSDNNWDDPVAVDAHVNIGWTYDYYYRRFGRRGLDNRDRRIATLIHGVSQQAALALPPPLLNTYAANAFWCSGCGPGGIGMMYFGDGVPPNVVSTSGKNVGYLAGGLDVAAHELTHGVTDSSSGLIYINESGALNEAFSDIMATSVEFFNQPPGAGPGQADYLIAEDVVRAARPGALDGFRSLANPAAYGHPDHYSRRYLGPEDNGGVHVNSGIANQAFYLAVEGGVNRTSGMAVQGVGAANRDLIERAFYRGFVFMLPASATFSMARAATVQAARDLFGPGSPAEAAIAQAWTAVGVD